ncbi:PREDICTED: uncharacterized protein LOC106741364 isoform X2 [Dinoponera quadriceps]|uniref:Uncharacterized protein LOC106741364 isoform X2 n=1 Tax=Dinoponera quadriceps TaxID=609295 RepID=A0A6P3WRP4_DINQU|nr:PREDICTED: uncharacterized protein LOC106741364 isoform X2 [Dinoponera quadriceps]
MKKPINTQGSETLPSSSRFSPDVETLPKGKRPDLPFKSMHFKLRSKLSDLVERDMLELDLIKLDIRQLPPGVPWSRYRTKGEVMDCPEARRSIRSFWHNVKRNKKIDPPHCKVSYRDRMIDIDVCKICAVYEYPATITFAEAQFALPLIEGFTQETTVLAYGYDIFCDDATKLCRDKGCKYFGCFSFSDFDKTVSHQLIEYAFMILLQNIDFAEYKYYGIPYARQLYRVWEYLQEYFIETKLLFPNGRKLKKSAGIPNDSYFTQLIASIVNYIFLTYAWNTTHNFFCLPVHIKVFGDISVIASNEPINKFKIAEIIDECGMIINPLQSLVTSDVCEVESYLKRKIQLRRGF